MSGKKWILLVAGSKDWENYKHQANVCGLYQIIKKHGIPDEQIVVMMYDDIAYNRQNPANGVVVSVVDESNVYLGVPKDYIGTDLTPENFLTALQGQNNASKKVIKSGRDDNIYIYMSGLGNQGTFEFPEKQLYPADLIGALKSMHDGEKFAKMVIYMDSSYSGTMFKNLPKDLNVFALTSCDENIEICPTNFDETRDVFLSDKFSSTWLNYLDKADFETETFHDLVKTKQSKYLKENPAGPCPCQFGDAGITNCHLRDFLQN
ncbi:legumain-like [Megalobrama amblycephala]|uniref:legumain-like n=1 Tax=Megalobrama amblycephala TaxID=75352 RepID=UPI0020144EFE|nr:legumain-like [Megalobrama amblycephala]